MLQVLSNTGNSPCSHIPSKTASFSQNGSNPYALNFPQHATQSYPQPSDPISTAPSTWYGPIADRPIAEPIKSHQPISTASDRPIADLPPLISRSSDARTLPTSQLSITPLIDSSPRIVEFHPSPQQSRQSSPARSNIFSIRTSKSDLKAGKLADWFKGESDPISVGIIPSPMKEKRDPLDPITESSDVRATNLLQRLSTTQVVMASRFSFFSTKASLGKSTPLPDELSDELLDMDVSAALFPNEPANPFSPASFKNLQLQAEVLLSRLQTAYKDRTIALRDMIAEKETVAEESESAKTRARHLKMQLDGMTAKFAEQDEAMMNLVDELAQEKQKRQEDEEARKRTIRVVGDVVSPSSGHRGLSRSNTVSDSGFESEDDSSADSVFSRRNGAQSPVTSMSSASTANSPDTYRTQDFRIPASAGQNTLLRLPQGQPAAKGMPVYSCTNCDGVRASDAWSIVSILKEENEGLKHRVGELEGALDGCLDVVERLS